jgi:ATP-dependent DNA helicase RecG
MPRLAEPAEALRPFAGARLEPSRGPHVQLPERLDASVGTLQGVGPKAGAALRALGLPTVRDLLFHRPRRFEPPAPRRFANEVLAGQEATVAVEVVRVGTRRGRRRGLTIVEALVRDSTGSLKALWFNQAWLTDRLVPGTSVVLRGELSRGSFVVHDYDLDGTGDLSRPVPLYRASEAVSSKRLRELVARALPLVVDLPDPLPARIRSDRALPLKRDAVAALHTSPEHAEAARRRLAFEERLVLQLGLARRRAGEVRSPAPALGSPGGLVARYRAALPFTLTEAQERVIAEIDGDLARDVPMERLLQGDVGAGKTVVALYTLLRAVEQGRQAALMAPTETLAEQHFLTVEPICRTLGVRCELVTASVPGRIRAGAIGRLASGEAELAVGTHALIQEGVRFRSLGAAVVDEQHRFGVEQRAALVGERGETSPHTLHMTATPIPRTLALTVWGDLAVSEIAELPAGRRPIVTRWITHERSSEAYRRLRRHLAGGRQAYVVCPLVSPSEAIEAKAAEAEAARLAQAELTGFGVGCLHGRLRPDDRRRVMESFARRELDVLVATTVIEVGVDVPNATIMIVQEADRFGLAQLHQLRGRVGRGSEQSYCLLVSRPKEELTDAAVERLEALVSTTDGFELAEVDLELRGEGQFLGTRQSGLSDLRFTRLRSDLALLEQARDLAPELVDTAGPLDDEVARMFEGTASARA